MGARSRSGIVPRGREECPSLGPPSLLGGTWVILGALRREGEDVEELQPFAGPDGHARLRPLRARSGSRGCKAGRTMSPYLWLGVWMVGLAASVAAHEAGHVLVGRR